MKALHKSYFENCYSLDTSAQVSDKPQNLQNLPHYKKVFLKRSRSKFYTQKIAGKLMFLDSPLKKQYKRAYYCCNELKQFSNKITAKYCNSRVCNICNRIRTAKLYNGYITQLGSIENLKFGTLTAPNVKKEHLKSEIERYIKDFRFIINSKLRFYNGRNNPLKWNGIRKIECTYNAFTDTYHPHIHFLGGDYSEIIINEWLKIRTDAKKQAQDIRKADKNSLNELFKYTTKILIKSKDQKKTVNVYLHSIDTIMQSLAGKRTFQPYGIIKKVSEEVEELTAEEFNGLPEYYSIGWRWLKHDWMNPYGELLTGYMPSDLQFIYINKTDDKLNAI